MRSTLFDFVTEPAPGILPYKVQAFPKSKQFRLTPRQETLLGVGFVIELPDHLCAYLEPRSSTTAARIHVTNADVPIDPDFRGEPVIEIYNAGSDFFWVRQYQSLVQLVVKPRIVPVFVVVGSIGELTKTKRGNGSHGSSGK